MAKSTEVAVATAPSVVGYSAEDFEWENVHLEQPDQITFDILGDTLIAEYLGQDTIEYENPKTHEPESFVQLRFMLPGDQGAVVNAGYDLLKAFKNVPSGHIVRVQYLKDVDVDQQSPMKSYRVDVGRAVVRDAA